MKRPNIIFVSLASLALLFAACNKKEAPSGTLKLYTPYNYGLGIDEPIPDGELLYTDIPLAFVVKGGDGDTYSLWMGTPSSDYSKRRTSEQQSGDQNFVEMNTSGIFMKKTNDDFVVQNYFDEPGEFTMTLVARNIYEMGTEYKETIYQKHVTVVDTACFLFVSDPNNTAYRFVFTTPAARYASFTVTGTTIQPLFDAGANGMNLAGSVSMNIAAGNASIVFNGVALPYNAQRRYYTLTGADFTKPNTLTVVSRSNYTRDYTILPAIAR
ncbi:MAG: hypothetical protein LBU90_08000 [Bacteroidales bacterium]|jgi:hypothetical protein|nr:hypothetical protein [Bacteroidales bacterium]